MRRFIVSSFLMWLLLLSSIPAGVVFRDVFDGEHDVLVKAEERGLDHVRELIGMLEETGFGNMLGTVIDEVLASGRFVFLFFHAEWCYFCTLEKPIIAELESVYSERVVFISLDEAKNPEALDEFDVEGFPVMYLVYGKVDESYTYYTFSGFKEKAFLEAVLAEVVNGNLLDQKSGLLNDQFGQTLNYTHHSCSVWKCYQNCIIDRFYPPQDPTEQLLKAGKIQQALTDFLKNCAGLKAAEALSEIYDGVQSFECGVQCGKATDTGDVKDIAECAQCIIKNTAGKIPGAGCVIDLWNKLGNLLKPHADCLAECAAPPSTWSQNWGHSCRPIRSPDRWACVGPSARGLYKCIECEWYLVEASIEKCPFYAPECVNTPEGLPRCKDKCDELNCDDGDPCTIDWCSTTYGCMHSRAPGCDNPDDNEDVSTMTVYEGYALYEFPEIGVLSNGFSPYLTNLLSQLGKSTAPIEVSLEGIDSYPVVIVPSGGLSGLDSSPTFKSRLESYVSNGGTLIVFSQQHGYEYAALPGGELAGYGWLEDQSCQHASVAITTYHSVFSGQTSYTLNVNADGFFTSYPENSIILLSRTLNGMPAMVLYSYGQGRVLVSTLYSDMASGLYQETSDEKVLVRDLVEWAEAEKAVPSFAPGQFRVSIEVENPFSAPFEYPVQEFGVGDKVILPLNLTNLGNVSANKVSFLLFDPYFNEFWANVSETIPAGQSRIVNLTYQMTDTSNSGIWSVFYLLYAGEDLVHFDWGEEFTLDYSISDLSEFKAFITVYDPDKNIVYTQENTSITILPGQMGKLNFTLNSAKMGVWRARYSILTKEGEVLMSTYYRFAVSILKENFEGYVHQGSEITFTITSDDEEYFYGSSAAFTFHIWNSGDSDRNVTVWWSFPHHYWERKDPVYGPPGTTSPGLHRTSLNKTLTVPAKGEASYVYVIPVYARIDRVWAMFYSGDKNSGDYIGAASRGFYGKTAYVKLNLKTDGKYYFGGGDVSATLNLANLPTFDYNLSVTVRVMDPKNSKIFGTTFNLTLLKGASEVRTYSFTLPFNSVAGVYTVIADAHLKGSKIGFASTYFEVPTPFVTFRLDKPSYRIGETISFDLTVFSNPQVPLNHTLNISIPVLSYTDTRYVEASPGNNVTFHYDLVIPETVPSGKHSIIVEIVDKNETVQSSFFIPAPKLRYNLETGTNYNAGEDISGELENIGGVGTAYSYQAILYDPYLDVILSRNVQSSIGAGEKIKIDLTIPADAVGGTYFLVQVIENLWTGEQSTSFNILLIDGLAASMVSKTDKPVYTLGEAITILTNITNMDGDINGILNIQILSTEPAAPKKCVVPHDNLYIYEDTLLCPGTYNVADTGWDGAIIIKADGVKLEGNNTIIVGAGSGVGISNSGFSNVTIANVEISNYRTGIDIWSLNSTIVNVTVSKSRNGIVISSYSGGSHIENCIVDSNTENGIWTLGGTNTILGCVVYSNGGYGVLAEGYNNVLYNNSMFLNKYNFGASSVNHTIDQSNTVDGKPIYWITGASNLVIDASTNAGLVAVLDSSNITVKDLAFTKNRHGVLFANVSYSSIENVTATLTSTGIALIGSSHNTISNSVVSSNDIGISIASTDSYNNTIVNNKVNSNRENGIYINYAHNNTLTNNEVTSGLTSTIGINLRYSSRNTFTENTITSNNGWDTYGFSIYYSSNNTFVANDVRYNYYGIYVTSSNDNSFADNTADLNSYGFWLQSSHNNTLQSNSVIDCGSDAIRIAGSNGNTIAYNSFLARNQYSMWLISSHSNIIANNTANNTRPWPNSGGIILSGGSNNNTISGNSVINHQGHGISIEESNHNTIINNTAQSNRVGISLHDSYGNTLRNNIMSDNHRGFSASANLPNSLDNDIDTTNMANGKPIYYLVAASNIVIDHSSNAAAVYCIRCNNVTVKNLNITKNVHGIYFYYTNNSKIENTRVTDNTHGIYLYTSENNTITANDVSSNSQYVIFGNPTTGNGIYLDYSNHNYVSNNIANNNTYTGFFVSGSSNVITNNTAEGNYNGIIIYYGAENNTVSMNKFCSNSAYDIYNYVGDQNSGEGNTCNTTYSWNDEGATGCTNTCGNSASNMGALTCETCPTEPAIPNSNSTGTLEPASLSADTVELASYGGVIGSSSVLTGNSDAVWETNINVNIADTISIPTYVGDLNVTGKLYLVATLYSGTGQIIAYSVYPFYITDKDLALTMETDKTVYQPGETIHITGTLVNTGEARNVTLTLTADGEEIYSQDVHLGENAVHPFATSLLANSSFTLEGTVDGVRVSFLVIVGIPSIDASIIAPDTVGRDTFNVTVSIENAGNVPVNLHIEILDTSWNITIPAGALGHIQTGMTISETTTLTVLISGDVNLTLQKEIIFGEKADITITPGDVYLEGIVEIPYTILNKGVLETSFTATFTVAGQTATIEIYLPAGANLTDTLHFNLSKGMHTLECGSPFWQNSINVNVESEADFVLSWHMENITVNLGERANLTVTVKNIGGKEGEARLRAESPGLLDAYNHTWIECGQEQNVTFSLLMPDDVEEKSYKMYFEVNDKRYETTILVQGAKISVKATLDKHAYTAGENATLTLTFENLRNTNLTLFSRVKLGDYDVIKHFNLTELETQTMNFSVPVVFNNGKMLYSVYMSSGRSLYINSLYVHEMPPATAGITLYTDKQVYNMEETVTIHINVTKPGRLVMTAPNLNVNTTLDAEGSYTFNFSVPLIRSGTYPVYYTFENYSSIYPVDMAGYSGKIIHSSLDKASYNLRDTLNLTLIVEVNKNFEGLTRGLVLDTEGNIIGWTQANHTFTTGENPLSLSITMSTNQTGLHSVVYEIHAYGSLLFIASGVRYFDAEPSVDTSPPEIIHVPVINGTENEPITIYAIATDDVNVTEVALYYRRAGETTFAKIVMEECVGCIDAYEATIPASAVTTATIEYYISATDGTNFATHPATEPTTNPHVISINSYPTAVALGEPTEITDTSMTLAWTESPDADFKNYTIYQSTTQGTLGTGIKTIIEKTTTTHTVTGLAANTTYHFTVRVFDTGGLYADSNQVSAKTQPTTQPPPMEIPWTPIIAGLIIAAVAGATVLVFIRKRKKK